MFKDLTVWYDKLFVKLLVYSPYRVNTKDLKNFIKGLIKNIWIILRVKRGITLLFRKLLYVKRVLSFKNRVRIGVASYRTRPVKR